MDEIKNMKKKVKDYERDLKKKKNQQTKREYQILDIQDTGELNDVYKLFTDLQNEIVLYKHRIEKMKKERAATMVNYLHTKHKLNELREYYKELKSKRASLNVSKSSSANLSLKINDLQRILKITNEKYDTSAKILNLQIKKLENEIKESKQNESALNKSLIMINHVSQASEVSLADLNIRSLSLKSIMNRPSPEKLTIDSKYINY